MRRFKHPVNRVHSDVPLSIRVAERFIGFFGSVRFIISQTLFVMVWIALNLLGWVHHWDPYPFILLNLAFSTQAAYAAPLILLAQIRQSEHDRLVAEHDYEHNTESLALLRVIHAHLHGQDCNCHQGS